MIATALIALSTMNAQYTVSTAEPEVGLTVVKLRDAARQVEVSITPTVGNMAFSMTVKGTEVFWSPYKTAAELRAKPQLVGNPFLAPWANRIEGGSYWANGQQYLLNPHLGNLRPDQNRNPIHGLVVFSDRWKVAYAEANESGAVLRSRLEFWRYADWMAQFPFAHSIEMTYRLSNGVLSVETEIENLGTQAMPVAIGFHPYYQIPGGRDAWTVHIPAKEHVELTSALIPNGQRTPVASMDLPLKGAKQDDVYTSLVRNAEGQAEFSVTNGKQTLAFLFGPKFPVGVVYAPPGRDFVCFEPMAGITDAFNQNHKGQYAELQTVAAGAKWREVWSIKPSGF